MEKIELDDFLTGGILKEKEFRDKIKEINWDVYRGKKVLIVAHGNSLRALVKYLDKISNDDILKLNIPTGVPLVYELDKDLAPLKHYYLGNKSEIEKKSAEVAAQGKTK